MQECVASKSVKTESATFSSFCMENMVINKLFCYKGNVLIHIFIKAMQRRKFENVILSSPNEQYNLVYLKK